MIKLSVNLKMPNLDMHYINEWEAKFNKLPVHSVSCNLFKKKNNQNWDAYHQKLNILQSNHLLFCDISACIFNNELGQFYSFKCNYVQYELTEIVFLWAY